MKPELTFIFGYTATNWLEQQLIPLALEAVGLPADSPLEQVLKLNPASLEPEHFASVDETNAAISCSETPLFGAMMLAKELADSDSLKALAEALLGVMFRHAKELSNANQAAAYVPVGERLEQAEAQWQRWQQTNAAVKEAAAAFYSDFVSEYLA